MSEEVAYAIERAFGSIDGDRANIVEAIQESFRYGGENGNTSVTDAIVDLAYNTSRIANAITPLKVPPGQDASERHVQSLTEAVMGMTAALMHIGNSIQFLAETVGEKVK